jgi:hypothetical protein
MTTLKPLGGKVYGVYMLFTPEEYGKLMKAARAAGIPVGVLCENDIREKRLL